MSESADETFEITVLPAAIVIIARHREALMVAANRQGIYWPTACGGEAICARCIMVVPEQHRQAFAPMETREREGIDRVRGTRGPRPGERLACQTQVVGNGEVVKKFVRPSKDGDFLPFAIEATTDRQ